MHFSQAEALDFHEGEPINPIIETETGKLATRLTFKDGTFDWSIQGIFPNCVNVDALEEAHTMGYEKGYAEGVLAGARTLCEKGARRDG